MLRQFFFMEGEEMNEMQKTAEFGYSYKRTG
jgi:hypothetical protein